MATKDLSNHNQQHKKSAYEFPFDDDINLENKEQAQDDEWGMGDQNESQYEFLTSTQRRSKPRNLHASLKNSAGKEVAQEVPLQNGNGAEQAKATNMELPDNFELPADSPQKQLKPEDLNAYEDKLSPNKTANRQLDDTSYSPDFTAARPSPEKQDVQNNTKAVELSPNQMDIITTLNTQANNNGNEEAKPMNLDVAYALENEQQLVDDFIANRGS